MKVLIADDSKAIQLRLSIPIRSAGYDVISTVSGQEALEILLSDDAPPVAILDWMMDDMDGVEVCRQLRAKLMGTDPTIIRPYLIMLTALSGVENIVAALTDGANNYLVKPWNDKELVARVQVAERYIDLQRELHEKIREQEVLLRRNALVLDALKNHPTASLMAPPTAANVVPIALPPKDPQIHSAVGDILGAIGDVFTRMGLGDVSEEEPNSFTADADTRFCWLPIYLDDDALWIDLMLGFDDRTARRFYRETIGGVSASETMIDDALAEISRALQDELVNTYKRNGKPSSSFSLPKVLARKRRMTASLESSGASSRCLEIGGKVLGIWLMTTESKQTEKLVSNIEEFDILAADFVSPWKATLTVLRKNNVLSDLYIKKLVRFLGDKSEEASVQVIEPPSFARKCYAFG